MSDQNGDPESAFAELIRRRSIHLLDQELERRRTLLPGPPEVRATIPRFPPPARTVSPSSASGTRTVLVHDQVISRPSPRVLKAPSEPTPWRSLQLALSRFLYRAAHFTARI